MAPTARTGAKDIDARIRDLGDWRGETLARVRALVRKADPDVVEDVKWRKPSKPHGDAVWSHGGILLTGEVYKDKVKFTFHKGASLKDPMRLFNASLAGNARRAIDLFEGDEVDEEAFVALVRAAVAANAPMGGATDRRAKKPNLLSGENPQIPKGEGDAPVQAYIRAIPGWKRDAARRLDALVTRTVPKVRKAVKWNSPFYGVEGKGWILAFHCFTKYVKVTFFAGARLRPPPPETSKDKKVRYYHVTEDAGLDENLVAAWVRQAAALPGWKA